MSETRRAYKDGDGFLLEVRTEEELNLITAFLSTWYSMTGEIRINTTGGLR